MPGKSVAASPPTAVAEKGGLRDLSVGKLCLRWPGTVQAYQVQE